MYILFGGPNYGATTQITDRWTTLPDTGGSFYNYDISVQGALKNAYAVWMRAAGTLASYRAAVKAKSGASCAVSTVERPYAQARETYFAEDISFSAKYYNGYKWRAFSHSSLVSWSVASGLSVTPRRSTGDNDNVQFYRASGKSNLTAYVARVTAEYEGVSFIEFEVSGLGEYDEAVITDYGSSDPARFEIVNRRFVRVRLFEDGAMLGDCSLAIGSRFVGCVVRVTPQCADATLAPQVKDVGEFSVVARDSGGAVITPAAEISSDTGAISITLPQGASCSVSYSVRDEYSRLWYLDSDSSVVATVSSAPDSDTPMLFGFFVARKTLYFVMPSANPPAGQISSFVVTSPSAPDLVEGGVSYYAEGTDIVVAAQLDEEHDLTAVYLDDQSNTNIATYTGSSISGNSIAIRGISRSCYVRGTSAARLYGVACTADTASAAAFSSLSATVGDTPVSSVEKGTQVTFKAMPALGYSFEGFYLGGEKVAGAVIDPQTGEASLAVEIEGATEVKAKAKVAVSLGVSGSGTLTVNGTVVSSPPYSGDVTLGDSIQFSTSPVGDNVYFLLWCEADLTTPVYDYGSSGAITPAAPLEIVAKFGEVDPSQEVVVSVGCVDRNTGREGTVLIDGEEVSSVVRTAGDTVQVSAKARNGWRFGGWFADVSGQGTPVSTSAEFSFLAYLFPLLFAMFERNTHAICEWEGSAEPKELVWRSKTYAASKPFNPSACRVDALGYPPGKIAGLDVQKTLEFSVNMFSAPDSEATATARLPDFAGRGVITSQDARRLPVRRMERYMQVAVKANVEIDALLVGTSMGGLAI